MVGVSGCLQRRPQNSKGSSQPQVGLVCGVGGLQRRGMAFALGGNGRPRRRSFHHPQQQPQQTTGSTQPHHTHSSRLTLCDGVAVERAGGRPAALGAVERAVAQVAAHGAAPVCRVGGRMGEASSEGALGRQCAQHAPQHHSLLQARRLISHHCSDRAALSRRAQAMPVLRSHLGWRSPHPHARRTA